MKTSNFIYCIFTLISTNCFAFTNSDRFKEKSNSADDVVIVRKISGQLYCHLFRQEIQKICNDKGFSERAMAYNQRKRKDEYIVLSSIYGKKLPGEVLEFNFEDIAYHQTILGQDYLMFIDEYRGTLRYHPCDVFEYELLKSILDKNPSIETLFNHLKEKYPNGSCPPDPKFNHAD